MKSGFAWRIIPATCVGLMGLIGAFGAAVMGGTMLYYNVKYGPIQHSGGEYESLDSIALTVENVTQVFLNLGVAVLGCFGCRFWIKRKFKPAVATSMLMMLCLGANNALLEREKAARRANASKPIAPGSL